MGPGPPTRRRLLRLNRRIIVSCRLRGNFVFSIVMGKGFDMEEGEGHVRGWGLFYAFWRHWVVTVMGQAWLSRAAVGSPAAGYGLFFYLSWRLRRYKLQ